MSDHMRRAVIRNDLEIVFKTVMDPQHAYLAVEHVENLIRATCAELIDAKLGASPGAGDSPRAADQCYDPRCILPAGHQETCKLDPSRKLPSRRLDADRIE